MPDRPLDLRLAFVAYTNQFPEGIFKARVGRQVVADLPQLFVNDRKVVDQPLRRRGDRARQAHPGCGQREGGAAVAVAHVLHHLPGRAHQAGERPGHDRGLIGHRAGRRGVKVTRFSEILRSMSRAKRRRSTTGSRRSAIVSTMNGKTTIIIAADWHSSPNVTRKGQLSGELPFPACLGGICFLGGKPL